MLSDDNTYSITSQVTDTVTATYTHSLTVTGRLLGEYQCSVSNIRTPSGSRRSLTVVGEECCTLIVCFSIGRVMESYRQSLGTRLDLLSYCWIIWSYPQLQIHLPTSLLDNMVLPTAAGTPTNLDAHQVGPSSFFIFWTRPATVTGYQMYWSGSGGADTGNMSVGAWSRSVSITGLTPGLTYNITLVTLSDHLPSIAVTVMVYTLGETHIFITL